MRKGPERFTRLTKNQACLVVADGYESEEETQTRQQLMRDYCIRSGNVCGVCAEVSRRHSRSRTEGLNGTPRGD